LAKRVRRDVLRGGGEHRLREEADRYFGMPTSALTFASTLTWSLYEPIRVASN